MLKSVFNVSKSYFAWIAHTFGVPLDKGDNKVQNWDYQCVKLGLSVCKGYKKCVQSTEKCVQRV